MLAVPDIRVRACNERNPSGSGAFVLYWMAACRRTTWNFALQRAVEWARELRRPLVVLESLRCGRRRDSDRLHRFVLDGMRDNARALAGRPVLYYPYVEPEQGREAVLLRELARHACAIVSDEFPVLDWPAALEAAAGAAPVLVERVDSNGILPLRAADRTFTTAFSLRRVLQKSLRPHLAEFPKRDPLVRLKLPLLRSLPGGIERKWPAASEHMLAGNLADLPIDHSVAVSPIPGGPKAARQRLRDFVRSDLCRYAGDRNHPDEDATSRLSPYLHCGHISVHEVFDAVMGSEGWGIDDLATKASGSRTGWWGVSESAEGFLDELITWRELGFNMCARCRDYDQYDSLPEWALETLSEHAGDKRGYAYGPHALEAAETHDDLWNAAQRQLVRDGRIHNYLRMLWGKKILEWTPSPREALDAMVELNNKYALDGRDPNSYTGIFWVLGRYDRAWGPERAIFGKVRYMSSENTARKVRVKQYLETYCA